MEHQLKLGVRTWLHLNRITHTMNRRLSAHLERYDLTPGSVRGAGPSSGCSSHLTADVS
jgi:hypothetical protein